LLKGVKTLLPVGAQKRNQKGHVIFRRMPIVSQELKHVSADIILGGLRFPPLPNGKFVVISLKYHNFSQKKAKMSKIYS